MIGAVMTGWLADPLIGGVSGSLETQLMGAGATLFYSAAATALLLWLIDLVVGLRVDDKQEQAGLDLSQHGERIE
jgi:Amt family ammonium transporter